MNRPPHLGLFGGSFNPVHTGHLIVARTAIEELSLDRLFLIPAARSPFKPDAIMAPDALRVRMLRSALSGWTDCEVDGGEIVRGGVSYTIDTVRGYRERHPDARLYCLIGADHAPLLPKWREAGALAEMVEFAIVTRPGQPPPIPVPPFRCVSLRGTPTALSASLIRDRVRRGLRVDHMVPAPVAEILRDNRLYLHD